MNFQRICYKNCRVALRLVLQFTANLLGSRKRVNTHSHRLRFAPTVFLFCSCILTRIIYTWLTKSVFTAACLYWWWYRLFSSEYNIRIKIHSKNTNTIGAKTGGLLEWNTALFLLPKIFAVNCRTRQNATWQLLQQIHRNWNFRTIFDCYKWL